MMNTGCKFQLCHLRGDLMCGFDFSVPSPSHLRLNRVAIINQINIYGAFQQCLDLRYLFLITLAITIINIIIIDLALRKSN